MSTQRIDYIRQNIAKFSKKSAVNKTEKTPTRIEINQLVNDENKPLNCNTKFSGTKYSSSKKINSRPISHSKYTNHVNEVNKTGPEINRRQVKTNLINKINSTKNALPSKEQSTNEIDRRLSNEKVIKISDRQVAKTRLSNEKATKTSSTNNDKAGRLSTELRSSNEKTSKNEKFRTTDKQSENTNEKHQLKSKNFDDKLDHQVNQIKQSVADKPTKSQAINEDPQKHRLAIEHELLKLKYLNVRCESRFRKQHQAVIDTVMIIFDLIQMKQTSCLKLEQQVTLKETLLFLLELSEQSLTLLRDVDLDKLDIYLKLVRNIINSALSTVKVDGLRNATNVNDILKMTTSKLTSDLKMDTVQEFADKHRNFDLVNNEIFETIDHIRYLKIDLIDEVKKRTELKNIY